MTACTRSFSRSTRLLVRGCGEGGYRGQDVDRQRPGAVAALAGLGVEAVITDDVPAALASARTLLSGWPDFGVRFRTLAARGAARFAVGQATPCRRESPP